MAENIDMTAADAKRCMMDWALGIRSHNDLLKSVEAQDHGPECQAMIVVADAAETQKWAAVYATLLEEEAGVAAARYRVAVRSEAPTRQEYQDQFA